MVVTGGREWEEEEEEEGGRGEKGVKEEGKEKGRKAGLNASHLKAKQRFQ